MAEQLDGVVGEFRDNGLGDGEDVRTLTAVRDVLGRLSADDMTRVAELLRRARDPAAAEASAAYAGQQGIVAQLRALLVRYQRQQAAAELAAKLNDLADRQDANLRGTVERARAAVARKDKGGATAEEREAAGAARSEQKQLREGVAQAMADLKAVAAAPESTAAMAAAAAHAGRDGGQGGDGGGRAGRRPPAAGRVGRAGSAGPPAGHGPGRRADAGAGGAAAAGGRADRPGDRRPEAGDRRGAGRAGQAGDGGGGRAAGRGGRPGRIGSRRTWRRPRRRRPRR